MSTCEGDCKDTDPTVHFGAIEVCVLDDSETSRSLATSRTFTYARTLSASDFTSCGAATTFGKRP